MEEFIMAASRADRDTRIGELLKPSPSKRSISKASDGSAKKIAAEDNGDEKKRKRGFYPEAHDATKHKNGEDGRPKKKPKIDCMLEIHLSRFNLTPNQALTPEILKSAYKTVQQKQTGISLCDYNISLSYVMQYMAECRPDIPAFPENNVMDYPTDSTSDSHMD